MKETCTPCLGEQDFTEMLIHPENRKRTKEYKMAENELGSITKQNIKMYY